MDKVTNSPLGRNYNRLSYERRVKRLFAHELIKPIYKVGHINQV